MPTPSVKSTLPWPMMAAMKTDAVKNADFTAPNKNKDCCMCETKPNICVNVFRIMNNKMQFIAFSTLFIKCS